MKGRMIHIELVTYRIKINFLSTGKKSQTDVLAGTMQKFWGNELTC